MGLVCLFNLQSRFLTVQCGLADEGEPMPSWWEVTEGKGGTWFLSTTSSGVLSWQRRRKWDLQRERKKPFCVSFIKVRRPLRIGAGRRGICCLVCSICFFFFLLRTPLHHPQWFSTDHHTFLTHIPPNITARISVRESVLMEYSL